ncbi:MAG: hypothetical protein ACK41O_12165 [Runella zeae]
MTQEQAHELPKAWTLFVLGGIILYNSYLIFRPALGEIIDEHVYDDLVRR